MPKTTNKLLAVAAAALLAASMGAQSAPFFTNQEGNLIWDQATGLVWMRCSLGQSWQNNDCTGTASTETFEGAQKAAQALNAGGGYGGATDWQVPSVRALASLRDCSNGFKSGTTNIQDGKPRVFDGCNTGSVSPTVDSVAFPLTGSDYYWTSSSDASDPWGAWSVHFKRGFVTWYGTRGIGLHIRLVRASHWVGGEAALAFPVKLLTPQAAREIAERKAQEEREAAQAKRDAEERKAQAEREVAQRKAQADRAQALKQLQGLGARGLYLEAGKAQRSGAVTFNNSRFDAADLYEMIVNKFPDSDYAVKATDQLTAMTRSARERSAAESAAQATREAAESSREAAAHSNNEARKRAYNVCKIESSSCYSRTGGKGQCYRDCDSLL